MNKKLLNFGWGTITVQWNGDKPVPESCTEVMIYDTIGFDPWSGGGIKASDFLAALNEAPKDRPLKIRVNSKGGDVHEGQAMMNNVLNWKNETGQKVICQYDGVAASTSSWAFSCYADEVLAFSGSQVFIHDAMAFNFGNAEDLRKTADDLDTTSDQIAGFYANRTGKGVKTMRQLMRDETLMTGADAKEQGFVDKLIDGKSARNFTTQEIVNMGNKLKSFRNSIADLQRGGQQNKKQNEGNMKAIVIAMLNTFGVTQWDGKPITNETSDEHLEAALKHAAEEQRKKLTQQNQNNNNPVIDENHPVIKQLNEQIKGLTTINERAKEDKVTRFIDQLIVDDKLTKSEREAAVKRAIKDETYLNELSARPSVAPGSRPLQPVAALVGESLGDVQNYILENGPRFMSNFIGARAGDNALDKSTCKEISNRQIIVANTIKKHRDMLVSMFNTNNIDAGLQRQIILQEMLEEFAVVLAPLTVFSTVFNNVPLEGTDEIDVPFYPLATGNGNSWDPAVGYAANLMDDTTTNTRPVVVGGSGVTSGAAAPANTCRDRKWIGAKFSSYEMARQPYLNIQKLMIQKANRLGVLIFQDVISRLITAGNFAASVKAVAAPQFSGDDIADLWETATGRNWPQRGRSLVLTHKYNTPLLKDPTFKQYLAAGTTDALRKAQIQSAYGFEDIPIVPNLDTYGPAGENLVGFIAWMYAILFATSPIMPSPDVRALMTRYDVVVHPSVGIAFEYRRFGDTTLDQTKEIIECSYGGAKGVASALARLTSV